MPDGAGETSVFQVDIVPEPSIWEIGIREVATSKGKPLLGRADVCQNGIITAGLRVEAERSSHPLHANIVGWPDEKMQQKDKAVQLWQRSQSHRAP